MNTVGISRRSSSKKPRLIGKAVIRWHVCQDCRREFMSFQVVIDSQTTADVAMEFAEQLEKIA